MYQMARRWKIIKRGSVPERANKISFACPHCLEEAELPVVGLPLAQIAGGLVFDIGPKALPDEIQCPACRHRFEGVA
jgi:rubredoxin